MNQIGSTQQIQETHGAKRVATILAFGTANPPNFILQADYPDFYLRVITKSDHMPDLKQKFKNLCKNSMIEKRHFLYNEDFLKQNPNISTYGAPSLDTRQAILAEEVPKLGKEAALKAIREWGQPLSSITHLIFYTTSCFGNMPGSDYHLAKLLGLGPTVNRLMISNIGCHAGGTVLRIAKDIAENNAASRVLVVWAECMAVSFHGPNNNASHMDVLIGQALFGDGAAAVIVGADPDPYVEFPLFELVVASQTTIPNTENVIHGSSNEMGLVYHLGKEIPYFVSENVEKCLIDAFNSIGVINGIDWNSLFYAVHPGGPAILRKVEEKLGLNEKKLRATWHALSQYGNMWGPSVIFILDEMRKWSKKEGKSTAGEGLEWGVLAGFGPGISMEIIVLRSAYLMAI